MGHVHIVRDFYSIPEQQPRTVRIYTPDAYDRDPGRRFGVLYMHDGQNVFAHPQSARYDTWCANQALERLVSQGRIAPWIIVGVDHGENRFADYSPWERGPHYAEFLERHLKPYVDRTYRTRVEGMHTATMGASLGGLISLYLGMSRPHVFGRVGGVSPSVMWNHHQLFKDWTRHGRAWTRIYLDAGAEERIEVNGELLDYGRATRDFFHHLQQLGYGENELTLVLEPGAAHYETDWQRRLPEAMAWLLKESRSRTG
jgi:predicted alpha/beta superfamily hydrolase